MTSALFNVKKSPFCINFWKKLFIQINLIRSIFFGPDGKWYMHGVRGEKLEKRGKQKYCSRKWLPKTGKLVINAHYFGQTNLKAVILVYFTNGFFFLQLKKSTCVVLSFWDLHWGENTRTKLIDIWNKSKVTPLNFILYLILERNCYNFQPRKKMQKNVCKCLVNIFQS